MGAQQQRQPLTVAARRQQGFTLFELVICLGLVLVLGAGLLAYYQRLAADAERAAFRGVLGWLQAGINLELGRALGRGSLAPLAGLEGSNPMALVEKMMTPPGNYRGERTGADAAAVEPGLWYFDRGQQQLIYRVRYPENRAGLVEGIDRVGFRLKVLRRSADRAKGAVTGLRLVPVTPGYEATPLGFGRDRG